MQDRTGRAVTSAGGRRGAGGRVETGKGLQDFAGTLKELEDAVGGKVTGG